MSDVKLFTAIYIPETPFVNGGLKPKSTKKNNFDLLESEKIADTLYHFIYKKDEIQIHSYYYIESGMDTYLDIYSPETVLEQLNQAYKNRFYEEDEPTPLCHIFGQQMWHSNAYLIANRTALIKLKEAIDVALKHKEIRLGLSPSDGEGYDLFIGSVKGKC